MSSAPKRPSNDDLSRYNPNQLVKFVSPPYSMKFSPQFNSIPREMYQRMRELYNPPAEEVSCTLWLKGFAKEGGRPQLMEMKRIGRETFLDGRLCTFEPSCTWGIIKTRMHYKQDFVESVFTCLGAATLEYLRKKQRDTDLEQSMARIESLETEIVPKAKLLVQQCFWQRRLKKESIQDTEDEIKRLEKVIQDDSNAISLLEEADMVKAKKREDIRTDLKDCSGQKEEAEDLVFESVSALGQARAAFPIHDFDRPEEVSEKLRSELAEVENRQEQLRNDLSAKSDVHQDYETAVESLSKDLNCADTYYKGEVFLQEHSCAMGPKDEMVKDQYRRDYYRFCKFITEVGSADLRSLARGLPLVRLSFHAEKVTERKNIRGPISQFIELKEDTPALVIYAITNFFLRAGLLDKFITFLGRDQRALERKVCEFGPSLEDQTIPFQEEDRKEGPAESHLNSILSYLEFKQHFDENGQECHIIRDFLVKKVKIDRIIVEPEYVDDGRLFELSTLVCNNKMQMMVTTAGGKADFSQAKYLDLLSRYRLVNQKHAFYSRKSLTEMWNRKIAAAKMRFDRLTTEKELKSEEYEATSKDICEMNIEEQQLELKKDESHELLGRLPGLIETFHGCESTLHAHKADLEELEGKICTLEKNLHEVDGELAKIAQDLETIRAQRHLSQSNVESMKTSPEFLQALEDIKQLDDQLHKFKTEHAGPVRSWIQEARTSVLLADIERGLDTWTRSMASPIQKATGSMENELQKC
ncbi:hypothetical protein CJU89_3531 [Yarrowia sp. B02]|nr:hypothetical protein CJU89_3531 [Yarrowia sp. B02]